jgi:hypothetical protein
MGGMGLEIWNLGSQLAQSMASGQLGRSPRRQVEGTRLMNGGESWAADGVSWQKRHGSNRAGLRSNCYRQQLIGERCLCDEF